MPARIECETGEVSDEGIEVEVHRVKALEHEPVEDQSNQVWRSGE
jgi:hypothetical protein